MMHRHRRPPSLQPIKLTLSSYKNTIKTLYFTWSHEDSGLYHEGALSFSQYLSYAHFALDH